MPIETLTYAALAARLHISPVAARSLARRRRLPRSLSDDGKALVSVDLAEIRHKPRRPANRERDSAAASAARLAALQAEIARLQTLAAGHRADFERERERADRLMVELLQATAETLTARETTARLEGFLRTRSGAASDGKGPAERPLGHLAAELVGADRKAVRQQSLSFHSELSADTVRQR